MQARGQNVPYCLKVDRCEVISRMFVNLRSRWALLSLAFLLCFGLCSLFGKVYASAPPKNLQVIDLNTAPSDADLTKAQAAFHEGSAIIRITGGNMGDLRRLLQVQLSEAEATTTSSGKPIPLGGPPNGERLKLWSVAVYIDGNGVVRSVQTFSPAAKKDTSFRADLEDTKWRDRQDKWIKQELSRASGALVGDPEPPPEAWTTLYVTTVQASAEGGAEEDNISVYRLNTTDPKTDYYLVYTVPTVQPNWHGNCDGIEECDWHTYSRLLGTGLTNGKVTDHGPTGTINTSTASFSIGVSADGPSATFGASWSQPDVVTTDLTTVGGPASGWDEEFGNADIRCDPAFGRVPDTSSGTFLSRQGTIYSVPGGTTSLQTTAHADTEFCGYGISGRITDFFDYSKLSLRFSVSLGPPVLSAIPSSMIIPAPGTAALSVGAYIPNSPQGLAWKISSNQSWLIVPTPDPTDPYNGSKVIPIQVNSHPDNSQGTLSIDTAQPFAAPSVESGPIQVNVTVGTPPATNRAGVLLIGGVASLLNVAGTVFYDVNANQIVPVGQPKVPRYDHTSTQLKSGEILIVGGATKIEQNPNTGPPLTAVSELFEPASMSFKPIGSLAIARYFHSAVLLPDGKVLIVGGASQKGVPVQTAELYDPASGTFTAAGTMNTRRIGSSATLTSGPNAPAQVLVYGGTVFAGNSEESTEIWSEASKSFAEGPNSLTQQTDFPTPVESSPGEGQFELVGGGGDTGPSSTTNQVLDIPSTFQNGPSLNYPRVGNTLTALPEGAGVLTTGGAKNYTAELKHGNQWTVLSGQATCPGAPGCMVEDRKQHTATLLPSGTVFIAGGSNESNAALGSTEIYDPATKEFTPGPVIAPQARQTAIFISTSEVSLLAGPSPAAFGQKVTLVATVTVATGAASGKVTFFDGNSNLGTVPVAGGSASLETSALAVGSHSLTGRYTEDPVNLPAASTPAVEVIGTDSTTTSLTSSANPSGIGQLVRLTAKVISTGVPTGSVTFNDGKKVLGSVPLSAGSAVYSTSTLTSGSHVITATYAGDASHAGSLSPALTQQVIEKTTTTALTVKPGTAAYGTPVSLQAVVSGAGALTGVVQFKDGTKSLGHANVTNGKASLSVSSLSAGGNTITASYTGDQTHTGSSSPIVLVTVTQAKPSITLISSQNPSTVGQPVTFTANIAGTGAVAPSGSVVFSDGPNAIGAPQPIFDGSANISTSSLSAGPHAISAAYSGDPNYTSAASTPLNQIVKGAATQTVLQSSPDPSAAGQSVSFSVTVSSKQGVPSGSARLLDGKAQIAIINLTNGAGAFSTSSLTVGPHTVTAVYAGDSTHQGSTSSAVVQTVNKLATVTTLSASPASPGFGQNLILVAAVTGTSPSGPVAFSDGGIALGSAQLTNGKATFQTPSLATGAHVLTATYKGDQSNGTSSSAPLSVKVQMDSTAVQLTSSLNPSRAGQPVTFTGVVSSQFGAPTGSVSFMDGTVPIGTPQQLKKATASVTTSTLSANIHSITATYNGNTNYSGSVSPTLTQTVNSSKLPVTVNLTSAPNPSVVGQAVKFTAAASSAGGSVPTGSVTLSEGSTIYGAGTLVSGQALIGTSSIPVGIHELRGTYGGDMTHLGATSEPVVQTVNQLGTPEIPADIRAIFNEPRYKNALWGLRVVDLESGRELIDVQPRHQFLIGSVRKLFSVGELLSEVGPRHRYDTPVYRVGNIDKDGVLHGNLVLVASGDLTMGGRNNPDGTIAISDFDHNESDSLGNSMLTAPNPLAGYISLARQVSASGIKKVTGDVIIDDRLFKPFNFRGEFDVRPIFVNDDVVDLKIYPTHPGAPASVQYRPHSEALEVDNDLITSESGSTYSLKLNPQLPGCIGRLECTAEVAGKLPIDFVPPLTNKFPLIQTFRIVQPSNYARTVFIEKLKAAGVQVEAPLVAENSTRLLPDKDDYSRQARVAELRGRPYADDAKFILKVSYNIGADTSLMLLGLTKGVDTMPAALQAEKHNLASKFGIGDSEYFFVDGSGGGLSTASNLAVTHLLKGMYSRSVFPQFFDALPILGVDGSLATFTDFESDRTLKGAKGRVHAKPGTYLAGSESDLVVKGQDFAGYIDAKSGRRLIYQLVVNDVPVADLNGLFQIFQDQATISAILWRDN
jgi:D-alanyl-D-alanine carboxypeptidase